MRYGGVGYLALLLLSSEPLALLLLEVLFLDPSQLRGHALDLGFVLVDLVLVDGEVLLHDDHLLVLLHEGVFEGCDHPRLLERGLSLHRDSELIEGSVLLLRNGLFLLDLFGLGNQALQKRLRLGDQLVVLRVDALELSPPVDVHRVLELLREALHLQLFLDVLLLEVVDLVLQLGNLLNLGSIRNSRKNLLLACTF